MRRITPEYVRIVHEKVIVSTGGSAGIRDVRLLESACARPWAEFGGQKAYPDPIDKAAVLGAGIVQNHPFVDGNKRVGIVVALAYLNAHGVEVACTQDDLVRVGLALASGAIGWTEFGDWLRKHLVH